MGKAIQIRKQLQKCWFMLFYSLLYFFYSSQILDTKHESILKHGSNFKCLYKLYSCNHSHHCEGKQQNDNFIHCPHPNEQSLKKKTSPQILRGSFLWKRAWLLAPGHGAPDRIPTGLRAEDAGPAHLRLQACGRLWVVVEPAHAVIVLAVPVRDVQLPPVAPVCAADLQAEGEEMPARVCGVHIGRERPPGPQDAPSTGSLQHRLGAPLWCVLSKFWIIFLPLVCVWLHVLNMQLSRNKAIWKGMFKNKFTTKLSKWANLPQS